MRSPVRSALEWPLVEMTKAALAGRQHLDEKGSGEVQLRVCRPDLAEWGPRALAREHQPRPAPRSR